jgi:hypothetical protein
MANLEQKLHEKERERMKKRIIWKPEKEEVLTGKVLVIGKTITPYGEADYCELATDTGEVFTIFMNAVLSDRFRKENVQVGDLVAIKFLGMKKAKKGKKSYRDFIVAKDSTHPSVNPQEDSHKAPSEPPDAIKISEGVDEPF